MSSLSNFRNFFKKIFESIIFESKDLIYNNLNRVIIHTTIYENGAIRLLILPGLRKNFDIDFVN